MYHVFPIYFVMLLFYGISCKKYVISILAAIWSVGHWLLLPLLPIAMESWGMGGSKAIRWSFRDLLIISAVILILAIAIMDVKRSRS